jgi:hypothetical protein
MKEIRKILALVILVMTLTSLAVAKGDGGLFQKIGDYELVSQTGNIEIVDLGKFTNAELKALAARSLTRDQLKNEQKMPFNRLYVCSPDQKGRVRSILNNHSARIDQGDYTPKIVNGSKRDMRGASKHEVGKKLTVTPASNMTFGWMEFRREGGISIYKFGYTERLEPTYCYGQTSTIDQQLGVTPAVVGTLNLAAERTNTTDVIQLNIVQIDQAVRCGNHYPTLSLAAPMGAISVPVRWKTEWRTPDKQIEFIDRVIEVFKDRVVYQDRPVAALQAPYQLNYASTASASGTNTVTTSVMTLFLQFGGRNYSCTPPRPADCKGDPPGFDWGGTGGTETTPPNPKDGGFTDVPGGNRPPGQ